MSNACIFLPFTRYQTADPERAKLRKHLYAPFSTSNLQKTTVHILTSGVRRLMQRLEQHAAAGSDVDMKKVLLSGEAVVPSPLVLQFLIKLAICNDHV